MRSSTSYGAFHRPRLVAGVGLRTGTVIWLSAVLPAISATSILVMVLIGCVAGLIHFAIAWAFSKDHKLFEAYASYVQFEDKYDAGLSTAQNQMFPRPKGYGKEIQF